MPMFNNFCNVTSFHGFKDFVDAKRKILKFFWVIIIAASLAVTCYELNELRLNYDKDSVATRVTFKTMEQYQFPNLALCPIVWVNESKVEQLTNQLSKNAITYAVSLLYNVSTVMNETNIKEARDEFITYLNSENYTVMNFYKSLMDDHDKVFEIKLSWMPGQNTCYRTNVQYAGAGKFCFVITFQSLYQAPLVYFPFSFVFRYKNVAKVSASNLFVDHESPPYPIVLMGGEANVKFSSQILELKRNIIYKMTIRASYSTRLRTTIYQCVQVTEENKLYSRQYCQFQCVQHKLVEEKLVPCYRFGVSDNVTDSKPETYRLCTSLDGTSSKAYFLTDSVSQIALNCSLGDCLPFCEQWRYEATIFTEPLGENNSAAEIHIVFNPVDGILHTEEIFMYEWDTFVSNIGGHLGLWMGGSVLSVIQLVYYIAVFLGERISLKIFPNNEVQTKFYTVVISCLQISSLRFLILMLILKTIYCRQLITNQR